MPILDKPVPFWMGLTVSLLGGLALAGWYLHIEVLQAIVPGLATMKVNAAAGFIFLGIALMCTAGGDRLCVVSMALGGIVILLGAGTLAESVFGVDLRIDDLIPAGDTPFSAGRMPVSSATNFLLAGGSLILVCRRVAHVFCQFLLLAASTITLLSFAAYFYGGQAITRAGPFESMALNSTVAFGLVCTGIAFLDPAGGLVAAWVRPGPSGAMARRLFPAAVVIPLVLGWLRFQGQRAGWYGPAFGMAILTTCTIMMLTVFFWWSVESVKRSETERQAAQHAIKSQYDLIAQQKDALHRQAELINQSNDAIITMGADRVIHGWNSGAEKLYGWTAAEAAGKVIHQLLQTKSAVSSARMDEALAEHGKWDGELTHTGRDGRTVRVDSRQVLLKRAHGDEGVILEINRDITTSRLLEEQLRQAQKLDSIGQLAGGVAHDFNNLLTIIAGYSQMLLNERDLNEKWHVAIQEIADAADRAAAVTRQLLLFSRRQVALEQNVSINSIVEGMEKMLRRLIGEDVTLEVRLDAAPQVIRTNPGHLEQVIMNLVLNARDAMPGGGNVSIETGYMEIDKEFSALHLGVNEGRYAVLTVRDTGIGMTPEVRERIFEPFFTTKEAGRGTGLGLSTVYGIVKQNNGTILVYSEPGAGSSFKVFLPAIDAPADTRQAGPAAADLDGTETILVVEDEEPLRNYIRRVLERHRYRVLVAVNGREALQVAALHAGAVHMVVSDVMMPEMGGPEFANRFAERFPGVPILFMSGYADGALNLKAGHFIQKPFTPATLLTQVRSVIRQATNGGRGLGSNERN